MEKEYYICSPSVVQTMKPEEVSKAVEVYVGLEFAEIVYMAVLDFDKVKQKYDELGGDDEADLDFWCEQLVPGQMNVDNISVEDFKESDPWEVIIQKLNLSKMNNRAMTICNICDREGLNPIDFWNKIANWQMT